MKNEIRLATVLNELFFEEKMNQFEKTMDELDIYMFNRGIITNNLFSKLTLDDLKPKKGGTK